MNKYITNNDRRPELVGFYRVIYLDGNTGVEYFDGTTWQVEYSHPVDRWLEESPAQPGILSPEEWLYENVFTASQKMAYKQGLFPVYSGEQAVKYMLAYAAYVSAHVNRETLHRVVETQKEHFFSVEGLHSATELNQAIMNITLRDVYPAGEKTESDGQ